MSDTWMRELQIWGEEREAALKECRQQIAQWRLTMPEGEPLVIHFGLKNFRQTGEIEFWVVNEENAGYCGKFLFVSDGQTCPFHCHKIKHETFYVLKGKIEMATEGRSRELSAGDVLVIAPNRGHSFTGIGNALLLEVSMPSTLNDNFFADTAIGDDGVI